MIYSKSGDIPAHQYCYVERKYITNGEMNGVEPCVWFGIVAYTGRVWGCQIMLKSGAVYREIPIHARRERYFQESMERERRLEELDERLKAEVAKLEGAK